MRSIAILLVCLVGCQHVENIESKPQTLFEIETKIQQTQARIEGFESQIRNNDHSDYTYRYLRAAKSNLVYYTRQFELQKKSHEGQK